MPLNLVFLMEEFIHLYVKQSIILFYAFLAAFLTCLTNHCPGMNFYEFTTFGIFMFLFCLFTLKSLIQLELTSGYPSFKRFCQSAMAVICTSLLREVNALSLGLCVTWIPFFANHSFASSTVLLRRVSREKITESERAFTERLPCAYTMLRPCTHLSSEPHMVHLWLGTLTLKRRWGHEFPKLQS